MPTDFYAQTREKGKRVWKKFNTKEERDEWVKENAR